MASGIFMSVAVLLVWICGTFADTSSADKYKVSGVCLGGGADKLRSIMALTVTPRPGNKIVSIGLAAEAKDIADAKKLKCKLEQFTKVKDTYTIAINMSQGLPGVPDCGVKLLPDEEYQIGAVVYTSQITTTTPVFNKLVCGFKTENKHTVVSSIGIVSSGSRLDLIKTGYILTLLVLLFIQR